MREQVFLRRRAKAGAIALAVAAAGVGWRMLPLGLPRFAWKYGGSFLWAVMVYWVLVLLAPRMRPRHVGLLAAAVALGVEFSRLYHTPWLDDFRVTLAGKLLLGKYFSLKNVVVYWVGIAVAAAVDRVQFWPEVLGVRGGVPKR